jgi:two-component system nitrogen regulation sensor histidine kinase GlnL
MHHSITRLVPRATRALINTLCQALSSGHAHTRREIRLAFPKKTITVDCIATPLSDPDLEPELLVELIQTDGSLRHTREENMLAHHQALRSVIRGLAHEIKNPLGGLRGAAQLLERELPDQTLREYTRVIIGEADRLQNLLDRMLGPHGLPNKRLINLHKALERVCSLVLAEVPGSIQVIRDYDPSIPKILADPDQLIQATLNIVRNAVQVLEGNGKIVLRTRTLRRFTIGHTCYRLVVRLDIIDNGPGIPPELLDSIFYPMVSGRAKGMGLGLSISQALINQHGGVIECESRPGETLFTVFLPLELVNEGVR